MLKYVHTIENFIVRVLIVLMLLAIALGTIELGRVLLLEIFEPPLLLLDLTRLFESFGLILVILIGIELLKILKMFLTEDHLSPALVIEVAIIALCNKIITLDLKTTKSENLFGIAALLVALAAAFFVLRFHNQKRERIKDEPEMPKIT